MLYHQLIVVAVQSTLPLVCGTYTLTGGSVDWTEVKNDVSVVLPDTAFKLIVKLVGGKEATGTVWFDDLFLYGMRCGYLCS